MDIRDWILQQIAKHYKIKPSDKIAIELLCYNKNGTGYGIGRLDLSFKEILADDITIRQKSKS